jgi:hypothetical protein
MTIATGTRSSKFEGRSTRLHSDKDVIILGGKASQLSALTVAIEEQPADEWSTRGA